MIKKKNNNNNNSKRTLHNITITWFIKNYVTLMLREKIIKS
jgi:hypothetical protein